MFLDLKNLLKSYSVWGIFATAGVAVAEAYLPGVAAHVTPQTYMLLMGVTAFLRSLKQQFPA